MPHAETLSETLSVPAGAQLAVAQNGRVRHLVATGFLAPWRSLDHRQDDPAPVRDDSLFDIASITKLFTAVAVMQLRDSGLVELDAPLAGYLPGARTEGMTVRHALTHTGGLPAVAGLDARCASPSDARRSVLAIAPVRQPGTAHLYSCVGFLLLGMMIEEVSGLPLDAYLTQRISDPLAAGASYVPAERDRCAATEIDVATGRGLIRGDVHDETAWALGGVAGNAGIFGSAAGLLRFAEMIRRGGVGENGGRLLGSETVAEMLTPQHAPGASYRQGLGFRIGDESSTGSRTSVGHPGYTGTVLAIEPEAELSVVFLSNAIHPHRIDATEKSSMLRRVVEAVRADESVRA